ncbi:hypothetical protein ACOMHN_055181 [Nucella lapillus]
MRTPQKKKYSPRPTDLVYIYQTTHGVHDCAVQGEASFRLVEIGGRSLTTPKLLHYFDNVTAVIFVASCCDVEPPSLPGASTSDFQETCDFFALVANDKSLQKLPIILLITKLDVLVEKGKRLDLRTVFREFKGDPQEEKDVQKHLLGVFRGLCGLRPFYHHFIDCTDLASVQQVFVEMKRDIRDSLLRKLLPQ